MFIAGTQNTNELKKLISSSNKLDLAVAFLGKEAETLLAEVRDGGRLICNLESGATNPSVIRALIELGKFEIKSNSKLHAKVYLSDSTGIVGSANLSSNGLGYEAEEAIGWHEASYLTSKKEDISNISQWFYDLWISNECKKITEDDLQKATAIWKNRNNKFFRLAKAKILNNSKSASIFDLLRDKPEHLEGMPIYIVITRDEMSDKAISRLSEIQEEKIHVDMIDAYEDWNELPPASYFISFYCGPRGRNFEYHGIFRSPDQPRLVPVTSSRKAEEQTYLNICYIEDNISGWSVTKEDKKLLRRKATALLELDGNKDEAQLIPLIEARKILFDI